MSEKDLVDIQVDQILDHEDERLRQLGIRRELRKEFSNFSTISFAICIMGVAATLTATFNTPIILGGRAVAIWSWLMGSFGCIAIAVSVAELVSAYPTSGGLYTCTAFVVPARYRASVTFVTAWITFLGQLSGMASTNFALSQMIFATVTIVRDGAFVASNSQILGLFIALNVAFGVLNSTTTRMLHRVSIIYVYINIFTTMALTLAIPIAGRGTLAPSKAVWTGIEDNSGWDNTGFSLLLGLLCVQYVMTNYDAVAHLSEEIRNAAVSAPVGIVVAVCYAAFFGFFLVVSLCYGIRDPSTLPGPTGLVVAQVLLDNLGKKGGLVLWVCVIINMAAVSTAGQLACIRSIYAISRDNVLPDQKLCSKIYKRTQTPVIAAAVSVIGACFLGLLSLASLVAVNAVFSVCAIALDLSYAIPIAFKLYITLRGDIEPQFTPGPFYTKRWSLFFNTYAVLWTILETSVLIMPQVLPITASTMNYSGPIIIAVSSLSYVWFRLYWHRCYKAPNSFTQATSVSDYAIKTNEISADDEDKKA
ncbi:APC amino acid permease [Pyrrhoderma noxium]|uniref:APC amino acid permease n=1 Tax=Pyrrhoderma noxium TaxID=2282107 RepID=A0A286UI37_9AGAM|nr:APC amino acid permease [Pyrrhoderma noxium]